VTETQNLKYGLSFLSLMSVEEKNKIIGTYARMLIPGVLLLFVTGVIFSVLVTRYAVRPISALLSVKEKQKNRTDIRVSPEVQYILECLKDSVRGTDPDIAFNVRMMRLKIEQIRALEAQINPHFFYNVLDTINWELYGKIGRNNTISRQIGKLSELLRMGFQSEDCIVTFKDELCHAQAYKELLQYGEANLTEVIFQAEPETMELQTMKFILQPLIENSIRHGFGDGKEGTVWVTATIEDECLVVRVKDNGVGLDPIEIERLNQKFSEQLGSVEEGLDRILADRISESSKSGLEYVQKASGNAICKEKGGVGLRNVNDRVKLAFGENYGIEISPNEPSGLIVTVRQPIKRMI